MIGNSAHRNLRCPGCKSGPLILAGVKEKFRYAAGIQGEVVVLPITFGMSSPESSMDQETMPDIVCARYDSENEENDWAPVRTV